MSIIKNVTGSSHTPDIFKKTYEYITEDYKTSDGKFIACLGCSPNDPLGSMLAIKRIHRKEDKRQFEESMLSVTPAGNEYSNEELLKIGVECANFWYGKGYQCVVALHLDSDFRHFHILVNSVSYIDGKKLTIDLKDYNRYKTHCSRILHSYGLDAIRTPAAKIIDTDPHSFEEDLGFFEAYDMIMEDNAACLMEMLKTTPQEGFTANMTKEESAKYRENPDWPDDSGPNTFFMENDPVYREYWEYRPFNMEQYMTKWPYPYFEPNATRPLVPSDTDFLPEPVIIKEQGVVTNAQDEFIFSDDGVIIKINCSRQYEIEVPLGYTESQIKHIVEALPRMSEVDKDRHSKRAIAASGKLKDYHMQGQVELDFSEYITFHWSDGTSSTVPRPDITSSEESGDQGERIIDVTYTEE